MEVLLNTENPDGFDSQLLLVSEQQGTGTQNQQHGLAEREKLKLGNFRENLALKCKVLLSKYKAWLIERVRAFTGPIVKDFPVLYRITTLTFMKERIT